MQLTRQQQFGEGCFRSQPAIINKARSGLSRLFWKDRLVTFRISWDKMGLKLSLMQNAVSVKLQLLTLAAFTTAVIENLQMI